jgi:hypothetical protein
MVILLLYFRDVICTLVSSSFVVYRLPFSECFWMAISHSSMTQFLFSTYQEIGFMQHSVPDQLLDRRLASSARVGGRADGNAPALWWMDAWGSSPLPWVSWRPLAFSMPGISKGRAQSVKSSYTCCWHPMLCTSLRVLRLGGASVFVVPTG